MDTSSSSKVTVEYHDPSGIFSLVSRDVASRLPLRNLNWRSQNRPLRQIKSLHLDFVPDAATKNSLRPPLQRNDSERNSSFDIVAGADQRKNATKSQRHQIPGLQTSPYLKIYVLRCDDKETYKATERAKLRDWIKQSAASKKKGNHDAFEWLILHVVIPDTLAASEPRWREAAPTEDSEELNLKERKQGAKWPGKSTRTVFDKLRADFNESGKSGQDRVAQIRLPKDQVPVDMLPTPAVAGTLKETQEERDKAWNDLMTKIKTSILGPFDQRVRQYETDITEQESRRSMPGFNFCTFFIHKEGLAKALESIGLVEDALVIYDELALGLETVLRDLANGRAEGTATTFALYTEDIKERIMGAKRAQPNGVNGDSSSNETSETSETEYREKIVRSSISIFDFFSYLFSRQKSIILRLANAKSTRAEFGSLTKENSEDLVLISEVCWRATTFIHNNARVLRHDLSESRNRNDTSVFSDADIESLVYSWTYEATGKVLEETASYALENMPSPGRRESLMNGAATSSRSSNLQVVGGASAHPQRTTSLPPRQSRISELQHRPSLQSASENDLMSRPSSSGMDERRPSGTQPGFVELVTYRASLVMMRRKALESLAKQRGWLAGWAMIREEKTTKMDDVDLNGHDSVQKKDAPSELLSPALVSALSTEKDYHALYERLSDQAMRYYVTSTQTKSAEGIMGDLAVLKYQQGDFGYAISYFQHVLPWYTRDGWSLMEAQALDMHAKCLKKLDRREDYLTTMLSLLAHVCGKKMEKSVPRMNFEVADDGTDEFDGVLPELITISGELDHEIVRPAEWFFGDVKLEREIKHHKDKDGFAMHLCVRHVLDEVQLDTVWARLVNVDDPSQYVWLRNADVVRLQTGSNYVEVQSDTVTFGAYLIDRLILQAKKLRFEKEMQFKGEVEQSAVGIDGIESTSSLAGPHEQPWVFLYPAQHALDVELSIARDIRVDASRVLDIKVNSGWNEVENLEIKLKPASAGLRLHLADATFTGVDRRNEEGSPLGQLRLGSLNANTSALVQVPYSLEQVGQTILVRLEAHYHTAKGSFVFVTSSRLPTTLPLDVDVHDTFRLDALLSNFTVRTTSGSPLSITKAILEPSPAYEVSGPPLPLPFTVFNDQPGTLFYNISRKSSERWSGNRQAPLVALSLDYYLVEELLTKTFVDALGRALEQSPFAYLSRLLCPLLSSRSKALMSNTDIGMAVLLHEAKAPSFDDAGWQEVLITLPASVQPPLTEWLRMWHEKNINVALDLDQGEVISACWRRITIPVEIPSVDVVHLASLTLAKQDKYSNQHPQVLILGKPVNATLKLSSSRCWNRNGAPEQADQDESEAQSALNFVFDIHADSDSWLIGGPRRAHFAFQEGLEQTFDLLLVPLRAGTFLLPQVNVHTEQAIRTVEGDDGAHLDGTLKCETHYESAGETVQVIRDLKTSRVHIEEPFGVRPSSRASMATTSKDTG